MFEFMSFIVILGFMFISYSIRAVIPFESAKIVLSCINGVLWILLLMSFLSWVISVNDWYRKKKLIQNGKVVGYKRLIMQDGYWHSPQRGCGWEDGNIIADYIPTPDNTNGIYITKSRHDPELDGYSGEIVRILGEGQYIEHERGYRVHKATVIGEV